MRVQIGSQWVQIDIAPRHTAHVERKGRFVPVDIEASVGVCCGPAGGRVRCFDPDVLAELGWRLLTASHGASPALRCRA